MLHCKFVPNVLVFKCFYYLMRLCMCRLLLRTHACTRYSIAVCMLVYVCGCVCVCVCIIYYAGLVSFVLFWVSVICKHGPIATVLVSIYYIETINWNCLFWIPITCNCNWASVIATFCYWNNLFLVTILRLLEVLVDSGWTFSAWNQHCSAFL